MTNKFKVPQRKPVDPAMLASFAAQAEAPSEATATPDAAAPTVAVAPSAPVALPWVGLDDKKRYPAFSLRLTAAEQAKLKFLSEHSPESMHEICLSACLERIEQRLKTLPEANAK
jgi:hypothetical protein